MIHAHQAKRFDMHTHMTPSLYAFSILTKDKREEMRRQAAARGTKRTRQQALLEQQNCGMFGSKAFLITASESSRKDKDPASQLIVRHGGIILKKTPETVRRMATLFHSVLTAPLRVSKVSECAVFDCRTAHCLMRLLRDFRVAATT